MFLTSSALDETGYVVLDDDAERIDPAEWQSLEYVGWRSSGVTRFAPLTSYNGAVDCNAFWNYTPPRADKDGVWIDTQVAKAPALAERARRAGVSIGRCRVIELQPNTYADAVYNLHRDDNNRLNDAGTGRVVRGYYNLTDDSTSMMILRTDRFDPATEVRLPLHAGARMIIDTERLWHAVWHPGPEPRYGLIVSWTSGPELDAHIAEGNGRPHGESIPVDPAMVETAQAEAHRRLEERRAAFEAQGITLEPVPSLYE